MVDAASRDPRATAKRSVGRAAAEEVRSGDRVGLGTGSTVAFTLERLAERQAEEGLELVGVPTSERTAERARELGIPLTDLSDVESLDLAIDGADEIDGDGALIKGGGAALTREKIVAAAARRFVVIVSADKCVARLGSTFKLPIEVLEFGWRRTAAHIAALGLEPALRMAGSDPLRTDSGNLLLDAVLDEAATARSGLRELELALNAIPGVVENGLFLGRTARAYVGQDDGSFRVVDYAEAH